MSQEKVPLLILIIITIAAMSASAAPVLKTEATDTNTNCSVQFNTSKEMAISGHLLLKNGLFEGDLKLSEEFIRRYYNLSSMLEVNLDPNLNGTDFNSDKKLDLSQNILRNPRAAIRDNMRLWRGGRVPYGFSRNIPVNTRNLIRRAMDHWETHTCLRFTAWYRERDYVVFDNTQDGCFSNSIGRKGGKQIINLQRNNQQEHRGCEIFGKIVHEIGHAVGFWHEQSRPDHDRYVAINLQNIQKGEENQFMRRSSTEVNSRGSAYDYGSMKADRWPTKSRKI